VDNYESLTYEVVVSLAKGFNTTIEALEEAGNITYDIALGTYKVNAEWLRS